MAKAILAAPILIALLIVPFSAIPLESSTQATFSADDWPMFRQDTAHNGIVEGDGPTQPEQLWNFSEGTFDGFFIGSSAAIVNGIVYIGSNERSDNLVGGNIYALNAASGEKIWNYSTGHSMLDAVHSSPAVFENTVYIGAGRSVLALDALKGTKIWSFEIGSQVDSSPTVLYKTVFVGSGDGNVYALNSSTGFKIWNYSTGASVFSSPAVINEVVYIGSDDRNLYALNATTGTKIWNYLTSGQVESSPVVANNVVYVGSSDGYLYSLNASTGEKIWSFETKHRYNDGITVTPAVADGIVYVCTDFALHAVDASTGTQIWSNDTFAFHSSPTVANGVLYISSDAFNASTGTEIWHFQAKRQINASPVIVNGIIYIASQDGYFYAIGEPIVKPSSTPKNTLISLSTFWVGLSVLAIVTIALIAFALNRKKQSQRQVLCRYETVKRCQVAHGAA